MSLLKFAISLLFFIAPTSTLAIADSGALQTADLGKCRLDSGKTIAPCRLAYRTYGKINAQKSNATVAVKK